MKKILSFLFNTKKEVSVEEMVKELTPNRGKPFCRTFKNSYHFHSKKHVYPLSVSRLIQKLHDRD